MHTLFLSLPRYFFFLLFIAGALFVSMTARAQISNSEQTLSTLEQQGVVPCGTGTNPSFCKFCDFFKLAKNVTDFIMAAGFLITVLAFAVGGFMILISSYSEEQVRRGKQIMTSSVIGLIIVLFAWLIVDTTIKALASGGNVIYSSSGGGFFGGTFGPWNSFNCEANQPF